MTSVRPSKATKIPNDLIGVAGVHFVAYRLSLRGLIVLPTIRNTAGIDRGLPRFWRSGRGPDSRERGRVRTSKQQGIRFLAIAA